MQKCLPCNVEPQSFNVLFLQYDHKRVTELSNRLVNGIAAGLTHVVRNGDPDQSYPGCVNLSFAFVEGESLLMALKDVALSSGRWGQYIVLHEWTNAIILSKFGYNHTCILSFFDPKTVKPLSSSILFKLATTLNQSVYVFRVKIMAI